MQGYTKGSVGPFITVRYNGHVGAFIQGYSKVSVGTLIALYFNG
jgi:hypothetical protein